MDKDHCKYSVQVVGIGEIKSAVGGMCRGVMCQGGGRFINRVDRRCQGRGERGGVDILGRYL